MMDSASMMIEAFGLEDDGIRPGDPLAGPGRLVDLPSAMGHLKLSADSPEQLRRCDVYRVLDSARHAFTPEEFRAFCRWVRRFGGPEIGPEVEAVYAELAPPEPPR